MLESSPEKKRKTNLKHFFENERASAPMAVTTRNGAVGPFLKIFSIRATFARPYTA